MSKNAIIFDFGGVLGSDANSWTEDDEVLQVTGLLKEEIDDLYFSHWDKLKVGKEDLQLFFEDLLNLSKKSVSIDELREIYHRKIVINPDVFKLVEELKGKYKLYILANESFEGLKVKVKKFNLNLYFDEIFNSAEVGLFKPDIQIYKTVLEKISTPADKVVFIDDQEKNMESACQVGISGILYTDVKSLREELKLLGFSLSSR